MEFRIAIGFCRLTDRSEFAEFFHAAGDEAYYFVWGVGV